MKKLVAESLKNTIIKTFGKEKHWPGIEGYNVEMNYGKTFIPEAEYELRIYLQEIKDIDYEKLWELIENYGQEKYYAGSSDEAMSNAGSDL